jgi:AcrR family transcriptional regulator
MSDGGPVGEADSSSDEAEADERETKGERTRRRLLELAIEQFGRKGMRATSVTEITREAGLTQAASYAYFENKAELFREAVNTDVVELIASATAPLADTPVRELLPSILVVLAAKLDEHPLAVRVLGGQEPEAMTQLRDLPALADVRSLLATRLSEAQEAGDIRPDVDVTRLATGIQVVILALLTTLTIGRGDSRDGDGATPPDVVAGIVEVFDALLKPPPASLIASQDS